MGRDKALVEVDGTPWSLAPIEALQGSGAEPVVLVGGDAAALGRFGVEVVADRWPQEGPLAGMATALDRCSAR